MTMISPREAELKILSDIAEDETGRIGAHVFYYSDKDKFSITKGCRNRGSIQSRIYRGFGEYCGFYKYGATPDLVRGDFAVIRGKVTQD